MSKLVLKAAVEKKLANDTKNEAITKKTAKIVCTKERGAGDKKGKAGKKGQGNVESKVIYLGHIPNGFYEAEMRKFFSQFGLVKRLKLFRSAKTNNSKGYAFVEFESEEIASVVSDAMNGYYLHGRQIVSNVVPESKIHDGMFKPPKKRALSDSTETDNKGKERDEEEDSSAKEDSSDKDEFESYRTSVRNKQKRLKALGIDFEIEVV